MSNETFNDNAAVSDSSLPTVAGYAPDSRTYWQRLKDRIFPSAHLADDLPKWAADALYTETRIKLSWADRLRVLLSGKLRVSTQTFTQHAPGRCESKSISHPLA